MKKYKCYIRVVTKYKKGTKMNKFVITKKIAKQGKNNVIVIPSCLKEHLKAGSLVKIEITNLEEYLLNGGKENAGA